MDWYCLYFFFEAEKFNKNVIAIKKKEAKPLT